MAVFGEATIAVFYTIFVVMLVSVSLHTQDMIRSSAIYEAVTSRYDQAPWRYDGTDSKYLLDVTSPSDLYEWLATVFATVTFAEQPVNGDAYGFCTEMYPCELGQGTCHSDQECGRGLVCGDPSVALTSAKVNGELVELRDLQAWCEWQGTPVDLTQIYQDCNEPGDAASDKPTCCYYPELGNFVRTIQRESSGSVGVTGGCQNPHATACCTREASSLPWFEETMTQPQESQSSTKCRPATVGEFNQVLMMRFSMKRYSSFQPRANPFKTATDEGLLYPALGRGSITALDPNKNNGDLEDKETIIIESDPSARYVYDHGGGPGFGGAYIFWINPLDGESSMKTTLANLKAHGWFDVRLATFTTDLVVFNGNVDKFMHLIWTFTFDGMGTCTVKKVNRAFNLDLYHFTHGETRARYAVEILLLVYVAFFVFVEVREIRAIGLVNYLRSGGAIIDAVSLVLCAVVLVSNLLLQTNPLMQDAGILGKFKDEAARAELFAQMEEFGIWLDDVNVLTAINLFVVFLRMVWLLAYLHRDLGLILKVLDKAFYNIVYFIGMFLMVMLGFVFFAFFTFGTQFEAMSELQLAFFQVFNMLIGKPIYSNLEDADSVMAPIFFYLFYVLFYLVMRNMFVSILMTGYDVAIFELRRSKAHDPNPFVKIRMDLRQDVGRPLYWLLVQVSRFVRCCLSPLNDLYKHSFGHSLLWARDLQHQVSHSVRQAFKEENDSRPRRTSSAKHAEAIDTDGGRAFGFDCYVNVAFMANFMIFMYIQTRGVSSFQLSQATLGNIVDAKFASNPPMRLASFDHVTSFEDVASWAKHAIVGMRQLGDEAGSAGLYTEPRCATTGSSLDDPFPEVSVADCNSASEKEQLVNQVSQWNVGFLNTTFVRLTIQPNCFVANDDEKWKGGYPLRSAMPNTPCADEDCTSLQQEQADKGEPCLRWGSSSASAELWSRSFTSTSHGNLGPYKLQGGYAVSLGATAERANAMLNRLIDERFFTKDSASMVFDFVTYNGNLDLFIYNQVMFSLLPTGKFVVESKGQAFPMNLGWEGGGGSTIVSRVVNVALFSIHVGFVIYFVSRMFWEWYCERKACIAEGAPSYKFLLRYYSKIWNVSDGVSMCLSVAAIVYVLRYIMLPFRQNYEFSIGNAGKYIIPHSDVEKFDIVGLTHPDRGLQEDWYIFHQFEQCQQIYGAFLSIAALNSFFISIKVVKFVGQLRSVHIFSNTLAQGAERIFYFTVVILLLLIGFALFYNMLFGASLPHMAHPATCVLTLFDWMVGKTDLEPLIMVEQTLAIVSFCVFMVFFYFIAVNMYLAAMMNTYSETVGSEEIVNVRKQVEKDRRIRVVEYDDIEALMEDISIEREKPHPDGALDPGVYKRCPDHQVPNVVVTRMRPHGVAETFGVQVGNIVHKMNLDRIEWRRAATVEDMLSETIIPDPKDGRIRITFKEPEKKEGNFGNLIKGITNMTAVDSSKDKVPATVKNFWRTQGAVTWVTQQLINAERAERLERQVRTPAVTPSVVSAASSRRLRANARDLRARADDGKSCETSEVDQDDGDARSHGAASLDGSDMALSVRLSSKNRLEHLLFSRWPMGKQDRKGEVERGLLIGPDPPFDGPLYGSDGEVIYEDDEDLDNLRPHIEELMVTGEEAWLDCLVTAIEKETDEESIVTEVLRTSDMTTDPSKKHSVYEKANQDFKENADDVLQLLECKARYQYYHWLRQESEARQSQFVQQNEVLHDYIRELEQEFKNVTRAICHHKEQKMSLLAKLAGLLDKHDFKVLDEASGHVEGKEHMERLGLPWSGSRPVGHNLLTTGLSSGTNSSASSSVG